jgi:hypothetical protein
MSDDEDASKNNLVCNGQTQQWQAIGVDWTKEGAKFDGTSSKMTLENVNFGDLSLGLSFLLRLKRQTKNFQMFLENMNCESKTLGAHLEESQSSHKLFFSPGHESDTNRFIVSNNTVLPSDPNQFVNVGATAKLSATRCVCTAMGHLSQPRTPIVIKVL